MKRKHTRKPQDGIPVLRGFISAKGDMINVWCPYCNQFHYHSWVPGAPEWSISHRVQHCWNQESPFRQKGYYVGSIGKAELKGTYK